MRLLAIVLIVAVVVFGVFDLNSRERDALPQQFGIETWTCAELVPRKSVLKNVGWVARDGGLALMVASRLDVSFLGLSCRARIGRERCAAFRGKWARVTTTFRVGRGAEVIAFDRKSAGVDGSWFDMAPLSDEVAARVVAALGRSSRVEIAVEAEDGGTFSQAVNLAGFNEAMNRCGIW